MSDSITFSCNHCGSLLTVSASLAGVSGPCPVCGQTITSPRHPGPPPSSEEVAAPIPDSGLNPATPPPANAPTEPPIPALPVALERKPLPRGQPATPTTPTEPVPLYDPPRSNSGSPVAHMLAILLILGGAGAAAWHVFRPFFDRTTLPEKPGSATTVPAADGPAKARPAEPTEPLLPPVEAPEAGPTPPKQPAETSPILPVVTPVPSPDPNPSIAAPDPIAMESVVPPSPLVPTAVPPELQDSVVREFRSRLDAFLQASTPETRGPLLFSEIEEEAKLADAVRHGSLSRTPKLEYKAVVAFDGPREGISQYYVAVANTATAEEAPDREILLHLANHGNEGFRVNADVLRFQLANELPKFAADPASQPLRAYVFIERAHFFSGKTRETPRGHVCVNLRLGPYTPVICQALVDPGGETGGHIAPLVNWGDSPKAVIVTLKHASVDGIAAITIDKFHSGNWLVAYPEAAGLPDP